MVENNNQSSYKELIVWQKSMAFANDVIQGIEHLETDRKHYRIIEQLEAAVTSIPMNIAEGKGRDSKKEYVHFLPSPAVLSTRPLLSLKSFTCGIGSNLIYFLKWSRNQTKSRKC